MTFKYSSITKKIIMSLMGIFLITFLLVHLSINLLILCNDDGKLFNQGAHFMVTNPLIQTMQWVLFAGFGIHIILGITLQVQNWIARPIRYKINSSTTDSFFSKYMIHSGAVILALLAVHFVDFFFKAKCGNIELISYETVTYDNMAKLVITKFHSGFAVTYYVVWLLFLGFHLDHAFHSAFQSLGLNHSKYTPAIKIASRVLSIIIAGGFIIIPLTIYFTK